MKKICVISEGNPAVDPRPHRVVNLLRKHYLVTIIGRGIEGLILDGIEVLSYDIPLKRTAEQEEELERNVAKKDYLKLVQIPTRMKIIEHLNKCEFDIIFCHDLVLLPFVLEAKKNAKVIFDAREYYPREMENNERWRRLFADFNDWLCKTYLPQADIVYTVCNGLAEEYSKNYGITCGVITSAAKYYAPPPKGLSSHETIKLIYHGMAGRERGIETMIETMDYVDERFSLDLMLVKTADIDYFNQLQNLAHSRSNVRILNPVAFEEIIPFTTQYDIGFYILQPSNFNGYYALPNKFFEFIQARLAIAIGPSKEMARYVQQYDLGIIAKDFTKEAMAESLNKLTKDDIKHYKENANKTAQILNAEQEGEKLLEMVNLLLRSEK